MPSDYILMPRKRFGQLTFAKVRVPGRLFKRLIGLAKREGVLVGDQLTYAQARQLASAIRVGLGSPPQPDFAMVRGVAGERHHVDMNAFKTSHARKVDHGLDPVDAEAARCLLQLLEDERAEGVVVEKVPALMK